MFGRWRWFFDDYLDAFVLLRVHWFIFETFEIGGFLGARIRVLGVGDRDLWLLFEMSSRMAFHYKAGRAERRWQCRYKISFSLISFKFCTLIGKLDELLLSSDLHSFFHLFVSKDSCCWFSKDSFSQEVDLPVYIFEYFLHIYLLCIFLRYCLYQLIQVWRVLKL